MEIPTQLGSYQIERLLGAGGMGEVYLARDTKLGRRAAVKVLPEAFARDPERVARFDREAKLLASLNHPNIATLYGMEEAGGKHFLVMELVEGETMAERLKRGPISVEEALVIARQIAEALEAAHEKGVVHRDLKPANVKITPEEKAKVLDFGLAKAMERAPADASLSNSPTLSRGSTQAGVILGTAAYMSPEQAKGLEADPRSDVFSFGCVLYEMLTGRQAFQGETVSEILAAVLIREPDLNTLPADLNPGIPALLRRCLEKNPRKRWQATGDLRVELEVVASKPREAPRAAVAIAKQRPLWKRVIPTAAAIVAVVIAGIAGYNLRPSDPPSIVRFPLVLSDGQRLLTANASHVVALSPDGTWLAYLASAQLFLRSMSEMQARPIAGTAATDSVQAVAEVFFSSDGQWIGFYSRADATLKKIAVTGGAPVTICKTDSVSGASWEGDQIYFAGLRAKGIMRVSADGGEPEEVVTRGPSEALHGPQLLNGGRSLLFTLTTEQGDERWDKAQIVVQSLDSKERKVVIRGGSDARYVPTGHLVYALGGTVFAVPFDAENAELRGSPVPILEGVMRANSINTAAAHFTFSATGSLVYVPGATAAGATPQRTLALADRSGKALPLPLVSQNYSRPRLSPDGKQVAFGTDDGRDAIVWIYDLKGGGPPRRLTFGGRNFTPIWTPDSRSITFQSNREGDFGLFQQRADGSGSAERLTKAGLGVTHLPESWSPDGKTLSYFNSGTGANIRGLMMLSLDGDKKSKPLIESVAGLTQANSAFSPDGKWLAYNSNEPDGRGMHVFVQPFPPTGAKYQLPGEGSLNFVAPAWSANGKQIFYGIGAGSEQLHAIDVQTTPSFTFGKPTTIPIEGFVGSTGTLRNYDVTPDGKFIVVLSAPVSQTAADRPPNPQFNVVLNWFEELRQRAPVR